MTDTHKKMVQDLAEAVEELYASIPTEHHGAVDHLRQTQGGILANAGICSYDDFSKIANTIKETRNLPKE